MASDTKERTTGVSWRLQVTNTGTEELIHCGERGHLMVKMRHYIHVKVNRTINTHTCSHTHTHTHTVKIKKTVFKMCKEKVAEPSCSSDSRRGTVKKHQ